MEPNPQGQATDDAHGAEDDVFPEHIGSGLPGVEAQHLDGGDLPDPLGDIDVAQIEQHDKGQGRGAEQHQGHHIVQTLHHVVDHVPGVGDH